MGNNHNCCKPHDNKEEKTTQIETSKSNNKLMTECENIDDIHHTKNTKENFPKENLNSLFQASNNEGSVSKNHITEVASKAPHLKIEIVSSSIQPRGKILDISPYGLVNSLRKTKDGYSYFGYEDNILPTTQPSVDYMLQPKDNAYDQQFLGKHFQIKFDPSDLNYYLQDLGHGFGTFIKLTEKTKIRRNLLVNIAEIYIMFTFGSDDEEDVALNENCVDGNHVKREGLSSILNVKIFSGQIRHAMLSFSPEKSPLRIGRTPDCEMFFDDHMLSRIHCTIIYDSISKQWEIMDGEVGKNSTNGTWIYVLDETKIVDQMTFKANHNLFICNYVWPK